MNNIENLFSKICRLCLSVNNSKTVPLFDNGRLSCYGQAVALCANVELPNLVYLPKNMCYDCLKHLRKCILFHKKCQNTQNYFKNIPSTHSKRNLKENIIRQLYKDSIIDKNDIINDFSSDCKESKDIRSCVSKEPVGNREFIPFADDNDATPRNIDNDTKSGSNTIHLNENCYSDFDTNDAVDDIFDLLEKKTNQQVNNIQNNNLKVKFKQESLPQSGSSIYDGIIEQTDKITNNKNSEEKIHEKEHSKLPNEDVNSIKKESNSNLLDLKTDPNQETKNTISIKPDLLFETIMQDYVSNELNKQESYNNANKEAIKNYKDKVKILKHKQLAKREFKTEKTKGESSKTESIKKDKLVLKHIKESLGLKVKLGNDGLVLEEKHKDKLRDCTVMNKKNISNKSNDFSCKICNRTFKSKNTWLRHLERHAGITAFICELCGKGFVTKTELEVHLVYTHGTGRYYPCKECGYKAPKPFDLKEHMRLHTGERPYACDKCGLTFRRLYILRQHQIYHTEKKFQCPKCPLRFYKEAGLKDHDNNVHARRYMYACDLCSRQYARNKTVRQHLTKVHGVPREKQGKIKRVFINETPLSQPPLEITTNNVQML